MTAQPIAILCAHTKLCPPDSLRAHPRNYNQHPKQQLNLLAKLIQFQGFRHPIVVSNLSGFVIAGHGRLEAAKLLGMTEVPVDFQDFENEDQELQHLVADNQIAELATQDQGELLSILKDLEEKGLDLELFGMLEAEAANLLKKVPQQQPQAVDPEIENVKLDRAAELRRLWKVEPRSIWQLGNHRIMCGDCRELTEVDALVRLNKPGLVYSDPPYGVQAVNVSGKMSGKVGKQGPRKGKQPNYAPVIGDSDGKTAQRSFELISGLYPSAMQIWWGANHYSDALPSSSCWIVWDKENGESFFADAELAYCSDKTAVRIFRHKWNGLIKASERGESRVHPTQKPVALAEWCITNYGRDAETILDPFSGSASCLIACERLNKRCLAMEASPEYVAVGIQRWVDLTGGKPEPLS